MARERLNAEYILSGDASVTECAEYVGYVYPTRKRRGKLVWTLKGHKYTDADAAGIRAIAEDIAKHN